MSGKKRLPVSAPRPVRLPVSDDSLVRDTRNKAVEQTLGRGGQASTILSEALKSLTGSIGFLGR